MKVVPIETKTADAERQAVTELLEEIKGQGYRWIVLIGATEHDCIGEIWSTEVSIAHVNLSLDVLKAWVLEE